MTKVNLYRQTTIYDSHLGSYRMSLEVTSSENITTHIFVNQRLHNFTSNNGDSVFVAVATPAQLEDLPEAIPNTESSYFRVSSIDVIAETTQYLDVVFDSILSQVQKLTSDMDALAILTPDATYQITADGVEVVSPTT